MNVYLKTEITLQIQRTNQWLPVQRVKRVGKIGVWVKTGVPNPQTADHQWSAACQEQGCTAGGEQWANERSFICRSPLLPVTPHHSHYCLNHTPLPCLWKNCLPRNQSLVPKKVGDCWVKRHKLLCIKQASSKDILYSTGKYSHYFLIMLNGV